MKRVLATILLILCSFSAVGDSLELGIAPSEKKGPIEIHYRANIDGPIAPGTQMAVMLLVNGNPVMAVFNSPIGVFHLNKDDGGPDEFFVKAILMVYGRSPVFSRELRFFKLRVPIIPKGPLI